MNDSQQMVLRPISVFVFSVLLLLAAGCQPERKVREKPVAPKLATSAGMAEYLRGASAVRKVADWPNSYGPGITITTNHYRIHTTLLDPLMLRQFPGFMEKVNAAKKVIKISRHRVTAVETDRAGIGHLQHKKRHRTEQY